jgi:excisionase family DNA binding protein
VARLATELRAVRQELAALRRALPPQLISIPAAARALGVSVATVRRHARNGSLPSVRVGARLLVDLAALRPTSPEEVARLAALAQQGR